MSDAPQGEGWWQASDGKWYPPQRGAPPAPPPPGMGLGTTPKNNSSAVTSLILGILGLVACGFFTGIPAIIIGNNAKREIRESGGMETGEGMATGGIVMGWISVVLFGLGLLVILAIIAV